MTSTTLATWVDHLRRTAATAPPPAGGALGAGEMDAPIRAAIAATPAKAPTTAMAPEVALWWARRDPSIEVGAVVDVRGEGPLLPVERFRAIEVWTDAELASVHALWWIARDDGAWRQRVESARVWHIEHTQPDNATNRPWALHVFLLAPGAESRLYAETLLHNCLAVNGRPDALSALLLEDAARGIEAEAKP